MANWKNRIIGHEEVDPEQLLANPLNWRIHPREQQEALEGVLDEIGWVDDIIVNQRTGFVVDGHLRVALAISQSQKTIPVKYVDISEDEEQIILATIDPLAAMAVTDKEKLDEVLKGIDSDSENIQQLLDDIRKREGIELDLEQAPEPQIDRADELQKKWQVECGQVWQIGDHRLMCGDSTSEKDIERLIEGNNIGAILTDPPYGINLETNYQKLPESKIRSKQYSPVIGDDVEFNPSQLISMFADTKEQFWWGANHYYHLLPPGGSWIVWDKRSDASEGLIGSHFEMCWSLFPHRQRMIRRHWSGFNARNTEFQRTHPTEKSIQVLGVMINEYIKNDIILDVYIGSGTTMIASEQLNRVCYGMEIEPKYCAVTLERMSDMGLKPKLLDRKKN